MQFYVMCIIGFISRLILDDVLLVCSLWFRPFTRLFMVMDQVIRCMIITVIFFTVIYSFSMN